MGEKPPEVARSSLTKEAAASPASPNQSRAAPVLPSLSASPSAALTCASRIVFKATSQRPAKVVREPMISWRPSTQRQRSAVSPRRLSTARIPANPSPGRGPRRHASSSARALARKSEAARPPAASGCFKAASSGRGAIAPATISATSRRKTPGGVSAKGRPAESSISIPQRRNSAATLRASARSGVTRAAVPVSSSRTPRITRAIAPASSWRPAHSIREMPASAAAGGGARDCGRPVSTAGRIASLIKFARAGSVEEISGAGQSSISAGATPSRSRSRAMPY